MTLFNNNGTIAINFNHLGKRFVLSGLGDYNDTKRLQKIKEIELRIKRHDLYDFFKMQGVKPFVGAAPTHP